MIGFLGCKRMLSDCAELLIEYLQVLLGRATLNLLIPQPVLILGIAQTHVQDFALGLVEPHDVHMDLFLQLV